MSHVDDQIRVFNCPVQKIVCRKRGISKEERASFIQDSFAHLGADERYAGLVNKGPQHAGGKLTVCSRSDEQQGVFGRFDHFYGLAHRFSLRDRAPGPAGLQRADVGLFRSNILREFKVGSSRTFLLGDPESFADSGGDVVPAHDLVGKLS